MLTTTGIIIEAVYFVFSNSIAGAIESFYRGFCSGAAFPSSSTCFITSSVLFPSTPLAINLDGGKQFKYKLFIY